METKCDKNKIKVVRRTLKFNNCFAIDNIGRSGGLEMLWNDNYNLQLYSYTRWLISMLLTDPFRGWNWIITGFYVHLEASKRNTS